MLDVLRIVSSVDVGHDEFSAQALVKKHKDVAEEIGSYRPVIDALHEQSRTLPPEKANSEEVKHHRRNTAGPTVRAGRGSGSGENHV